MGEREKPYFPEWHGEIIKSGNEIPKPLFEGGWVFASKSALTALAKAGEDYRALLERHLTGDWGDLRKDEKMLNDLAVEDGEEILSAYVLPTNDEFWVITDKNRQTTVIELAEEVKARQQENLQE